MHVDKFAIIYARLTFLIHTKIFCVEFSIVHSKYMQEYKIFLKVFITCMVRYTENWLFHKSYDIDLALSSTVDNFISLKKIFHE